MPAGLDGNPDPIVTEARTAVIEAVAVEVRTRKQAGSPLLVAIDGIDGSGKSTFADELASCLRGTGTAVVRSTIDSFHNPRSVRYRRGPGSPVGFYLDSHDLDAVKTYLLEPLAAGRGGYVTAAFDEPSDQPVARQSVEVAGDEILVFDGIFALRPEFATYWHLTVFLDAQQRVDLGRLGYVMSDLPTDPVDVVAHVLEWQRRIDRYASGIRYYLDIVDPVSKADIVIDNNRLAAPCVVG